jgi:hypothetical protein
LLKLVDSGIFHSYKIIYIDLGAILVSCLSVG